jgi:hypothetical protein
MIVKKNKTDFISALKQQYNGVDIIEQSTPIGSTWYVKSGTNKIKIGDFNSALNLYSLVERNTLTQHIFDSISSNDLNGGVHGLRFDGTTLYGYNNNAWEPLANTGAIGDVTGPNGAVDNNIATYDDVTGKLIKDSGIPISDITNLDTTYLKLDASNDPMQGDLSMGEFGIEDIRQLIFDTTPATPGTAEGTIHWNGTDFTLNIVTGLGPVLQIGQEIYILVWNATGSQIDDGRVVHPVGGATNQLPHIEKAIFDTHVGFTRDVWVTTMDIPSGQLGIATKFGKARGIDTSMFSNGDNIWGSPTTAGGLTNVKPQFPDYPVQIGGIANAATAPDGVLVVDVKGEAIDTITNFWNGVMRESFDFRITSDGATVTGTLTPTNGHPDETMMFSDGFTMLDTDPGATIILTPGTDENPQENFVYILKTAKVLALSTSDFPVAQHIKIAHISLWSASMTQSAGALANQNVNDEIEDTTTFQGHLTHITRRIRAFGAGWESGTEGSLTVTGGVSDVFVSVTAGKVFQLHLHDYPVQDMSIGDDIHVINDPVTPWRTTDNLNDLTDDANGDTLNNRYFSIVVWGICNKSGELSHILCNLPIGSYVQLDSAISDALNYTVYDIPSEYKGVAFLIARFTFRKSGTTFTYDDTQGYRDLRGLDPNTISGGAAGSSGITTYLGLTDTPSSNLAQALKLIQVNAGETSHEYITADNIGLTDVITNDSSTTKHGFLKKLSNASTEFMNGQGNWAVPSGGGGGRELLTADRTYFVSPSGSDANDGLTTGTPFLTIQFAIDTAAMLDISIHNVIIDLWTATGVGTVTYTPTAIINVKYPIGGGQVILQGNSANQDSVIIQGTGLLGIFTKSDTANANTAFTMKNLQIDGNGSTGTRHCLNFSGACLFIIDGVHFKDAGRLASLAQDASIRFADNNNSIKISGVFNTVFFMELNAKIKALNISFDTSSLTSFVTFISMVTGSNYRLEGAGTSFTTTAIPGTQWLVFDNSILKRQSGLVVPGNTAGTPAPGVSPWGGEVR